jgi:hypothetical protein
MVVAALALVLLPRGAVAARDMCDMLKDKGLLNEAEYNECKASQEKQEDRWTRNLQDFVKNWIQYKEGTGFILNSAATAPQDFRNPTPKPRFSFSLGNRLQVRYTFLSPDSSTQDEDSSFRVRRFKTFMGGNAFFPWLKYKTQVNWVGFNEPDARQDTPELEDALMDVVYFPYAAVQIGQYKVPFNRQQLTSSGAQQFVDRAITDARFTFARDQGLMVHGLLGEEKMEWLDYSLGIFNGNGRDRSNNDNPEHLGVGRVYLTPMGPFPYSESDTDNTPKPKLALGTAYGFNPVRNRTTTNVPITVSVPDPDDPSMMIDVDSGRQLSTTTTADAEIHRFTADAHFKWRGLSALLDYYWESRDDKATKVSVMEIGTDGRPGSPMAGTPRRNLTTQTYGLLVQAGYFIWPKHVELAGRFAMIDTDGRDNGVQEARGGINYFVFAHNLKLQADFGSTMREVRDAPDTADFEARVQAQLIF